MPRHSQRKPRSSLQRRSVSTIRRRSSFPWNRPQSTYDANGALVAKTYPNGMTRLVAVYETASATSIVYTKASNCSGDCDWYTDQAVPSIHGQWLAQNSSLSSQQCQYDSAERLTQVQDTVNAQCTARQFAFVGSARKDSNRTSLTTIPPNADRSCASAGGTVISSTHDGPGAGAGGPSGCRGGGFGGTKCNRSRRRSHWLERNRPSRYPARTTPCSSDSAPTWPEPNSGRRLRPLPPCPFGTRQARGLAWGPTSY
jgi:hypothetical protein